jgi:hypothetical protein
MLSPPIRISCPLCGEEIPWRARPHFRSKHAAIYERIAFTRPLYFVGLVVVILSILSIGLVQTLQLTFPLNLLPIPGMLGGVATTVSSVILHHKIVRQAGASRPGAIHGLW